MIFNEITDGLFKKLLNGKIAVGNALKLGNKEASEYALQSAVDNIQTTSKATLSEAGWYRVAILRVLNEYLAQGSYGHVAEMLIERVYNNTPNEVHRLQLESVFGSQKIVSMGSNSRYQLLTKSRYTRDSENNAYLEVYYTGSTDNECSFTIRSTAASFAWQAITPTLTEETVDGVTVTTTYDIPANASPVTDLDITEAVNTINLGKRYMYESDLDTFKEDNEVKDFWTYIATIVPKTTSDNSYIFNGGSWTLVGMEYSDKRYGYQLGISGSQTKAIKVRTLYNGVWGEWEGITTTADLANYLPIGSTAYSPNETPIQTGTVTGAGWYRIAQTTFTGETGILTIKIGKGYTSGLTCESIMLTLAYGYQNAKFCQVANNMYHGISDTYEVTKIRYVGSNYNAPAYIDIYVNTDSKTALSTSLCTEVLYNGNKFANVAFTAVEEEVESGYSATVFEFSKYSMKVDGIETNTVNGYVPVHSGNVGEYALTKDGGTFNAGKSIGFTAGETGGSAVGASFKNNDGTTFGRIGAMSVNGVGTYVYIGATSSPYSDSVLSIYPDDIKWKNNTVHHDGNSAKVVVSETALTAEGSIRVW